MDHDRKTGEVSDVRCDEYLNTSRERFISCLTSQGSLNVVLASLICLPNTQGVGPQEYTAIKMRITSLPPALSALAGQHSSIH